MVISWNVLARFDLRLFNSLFRMRFLAVLKRKMQFSWAKQLLVHIFWLVRSVQKGQVHFADEIVTRRNFPAQDFVWWLVPAWLGLASMVGSGSLSRSHCLLVKLSQIHGTLKVLIYRKKWNCIFENVFLGDTFKHSMFTILL